jgi:tetratricopeptide (TPR) repeat protein
LRATGRGIDAMKDFERAAKLRPDLAAPHLELAKLYFSRGQGEAGEQAIAAAERARGRSDPDVILVLSQLLVARGDLVNSARNARLLEAMQHQLRGGAEELASLYTQLGAAAESARDEPLALEMASKASALGSDATGENAARVARLLRQKRDYERELAVLKDAELHELPVAELREQIVAAYKNLGYARLLANDKAGACGSFLDAAARAEHVEELGALPELIRKLSAEVKGETEERVLAVAKTAYVNAQDEAKAQDWRGAEGAYRVSLALLPQNPYAWFQLGEALAAQKRTQDAIEAWTKAKELGEVLGMLDVVERAKERLSSGS